jgi:hypothetical protein
MEPRTSGFERHLTNGALADRLRRIVENPKSWPKSEREALILEAARRVEHPAERRADGTR